ncbi:hypothetical protein KP79_PYT09816 [Mizuhopecten yessoensis]|uniref:Protein CEBPZOS n=1 Tax=Mizuhopecten yessoensis TaxID=6573 RepID=A0A210PL19_MIZYE|nr:hypothetical protein KP79_PYT09816 [Mizuhopecten yessoensis]
MLTKTPQKMRISSKVKLFVGFGIVGELTFLGFGFVYFMRMTKDIELRKKMYTKIPWISEMYYRTVELMPEDKTNPLTLRQRDYASWGVTEESK